MKLFVVTLLNPLLSLFKSFEAFFKLLLKNPESVLLPVFPPHSTRPTQDSHQEPPASTDYEVNTDKPERRTEISTQIPPSFNF
jgi:hypothetical protein